MPKLNAFVSSTTVLSLLLMIAFRHRWFGSPVIAAAEQQEEKVSYGVDCSYPIHYGEFRCGDLLGDRKKFYDDFMDGCRKKYGKLGYKCDETEKSRLEMSLRQPQSMVNFTSTGFMKIQAPKEVRELLSKHWELNKDKREVEAWGAGYTYTNHWEAPSYMVSVENNRLRGGGFSLKQSIWEAAKETIEQWTGMEQSPISMYGIRIYTEGAVLAPHVDRLPLVSSAIVNVAQDVDEPWPLEVIDRNGNAVNVTMEPFDMVLYESGSLIHSRPFPLKGRYFANIFIHFEPTGRRIAETNENWEDELDSFLPPYLLPDSPEVENWSMSHPHGWKRNSPAGASAPNDAHDGHAAAASGDIYRIKELARKDKRALQRKDQNGWQPLHEAVRGGHTEIVKLLIKNGVEKDARTGRRGEGSSALNLALEFLSDDHPVSKYLLSIGAKNIGEEL